MVELLQQANPAKAPSSPGTDGYPFARGDPPQLKHECANWLRVLQWLLTSCSLCRNWILQGPPIFFTRAPCLMGTTTAKPATPSIPVQLSALNL
jgi:hypothetical protein